MIESDREFFVNRVLYVLAFIAVIVVWLTA
jgi:hypothetical protein